VEDFLKERRKSLRWLRGLDMLLVFPGWWDLSLLFFLVPIMLIVFIITQFMLLPCSADRGER